MTVIIRDDDTSFFTPPARLEKIYGRLWEQGVPVCISVIPAQNANVRVDHRPNRPFDPSIPPSYRGVDQRHSILDNRALCAFLNEKARQSLVEICQHGYAHTYMEFLSEDADSIRRKLSEGKHLLHAAFPDAPVRTFVAPYDRISAVALAVVLDAGYDICTSTENLAASGALSHFRPYQVYRISDGRRLFTCDEYLFTHREDPEACFRSAQERLQAEKLLIVCNHYWTFFFDWNDSFSALWHKWERFGEALMSLPDHDIQTFSNLAFPNGE